MWTHSQLFIFCVMLCLIFQVVEMTNDECYSNEERGVYYNDLGYATFPIKKQLTDLVSSSNTADNEGGMVEKCFTESMITYDDYIQLLNMNLAKHRAGKCFLGCILYKMNTVDANYQPYKWTMRIIIALLPGYVTGFGEEYIFDAKDKTIYGTIDTKKYVKDAIKIGLDCLSLKRREDDKDNCERVSKFMKCIIENELFKETLKQETLDIRVIKLKYDKNEEIKKNEVGAGPSMVKT